MATKKKTNPSAPTTPRAHRALFDAVYLDPSSDAPREALACALSEAGDQRGELIRLQLTKARGDKLTREQDKREKALLKAHVEEWLGPFAPLVRKSDCVFERGFPSLLWFKTVSTQQQIREFEAILMAEEWATVKRTDSLLKLSAKMRSLEDAGSSIEALREAAEARLEDVVPLEKLRVINLGLSTRADVEVVRSFPKLRTLQTSYRDEVTFADLLDAPWPALEALGTGQFERDFPLWLERRSTSRLRTVYFGHAEFQLRLAGQHAHVSHVRQLLDGALPNLLKTVFESGVEKVTADEKSVPLVAPVAQAYGLEVVALDETD